MEWNTKSDGSGTSYEPGAVYKANKVVTLYAVWSRYYESGLFGSKLSKSQIFDNVTSDNTINGKVYDASWGDADDSTGHQFSDEQLEGRFFVFRYSGDEDYPVALYMFEADGTQVTKSSSKNLIEDSLIGEEDNECLSEDGYDYMTETYSEGIKGLVAQGYVSQYDENGVTFISANGFGYYASINRGYKKGDTIEWNNVVTDPAVEQLDSIDTFADAEMFDGEYAIIYKENTEDVVTDNPQTQNRSVPIMNLPDGIQKRMEPERLIRQDPDTPEKGFLPYMQYGKKRRKRHLVSMKTENRSAKHMIFPMKQQWKIL